MFLKAAAVVLGMSMALAGNATKHNDVETRYFIGTFNLGEFPLAIDLCNPYDIIGQLYQKATCVDESNLEWNWYTASDCSAPTTYKTFNFNASSQNGLGFFGDFNCDSSLGDSYTTVAFSTTACDQTNVQFVSMNTVVGVCTYTGISNPAQEDLTSIELYCEDSLVELQYYDATTVNVSTCTDEYLTSIANGTVDCDWMLETQGTDVYGYIEDCVIANTTTGDDDDDDDDDGDDDDDDDDDSASTLSMAGLFVVSIIAAIKL